MGVDGRDVFKDLWFNLFKYFILLLLVEEYRERDFEKLEEYWRMYYEWCVWMGFDGGN